MVIKDIENILLCGLMLVKVVFLIFFVLFGVISFFVDLPPGSLVTNAVDLSFPYASVLTTNLLNGVFFGSIMALVVFLGRRKSKLKIPKYSPPTVSKFDRQIENLEDKGQKVETSQNLTQINGIGPRRALELKLAGVTTVSDLATRSPQHLSEKTGIPIVLISKWIIEANKLTK